MEMSMKSDKQDRVSTKTGTRTTKNVDLNLKSHRGEEGEPRAHPHPPLLRHLRPTRSRAEPISERSE